MNPYVNLESYYRDVLKFVDLKLAAYYEATKHHESNSSLGWQLKQMTEAALSYEQDADQLKETMKRRVEETMSTSLFIPLEHALETFKLNSFEQFCIYLSIAIELDPSFEKNIRYFNESLSTPFPTLGLALKVYCRDLNDYLNCRSEQTHHSKLMKYFYTDSFVNAYHQPFIGIPMALDTTVTHFILNFDGYQINESYMAIAFPNATPTDHHFSAIEQQLHEFFEQNHQNKLNKNLLFFIHGPKSIGKKALVTSFCNVYDQTAIFVDCKTLLLQQPGVSQIQKICREALLHRATLVFNHFEMLSDHLDDPAYAQFVEQLFKDIQSFSKVSFALSTSPWHPQSEYSDISIVEVPLPVLSALERRDYWITKAESYPLSSEIDLSEIANKFKLMPKQIDKALRDAENYRRWLHLDEIDQKLLHRANYFQLSHSLKDTTQLIRSHYSWEDLILPQEQSQQLQEACNQIKYRHIVYAEWGFDKKVTYGTGLGLLFTGPPGTGKTLAAQVVANVLNLEIYRVDLSQIISKYIGETEKNLKAIFDEASLSNAILLFDEGDALFSKRTEVSDAHDKYANVETSYLLQKIEAYEGISIVTTNLLGNIDEAFIRRFAFVVHFPFPTPEFRRKIWRHVFPKEAPLAKTIDFEYLGNRFELSGGNIKNIALNAAFLAASKHKDITMRDILHSVSSEVTKTGKSILPSDFGEYAYLLTTPEF